jgi:pimeloyl-ACP methyl ester carboxylesterase
MYDVAVTDMVVADHDDSWWLPSLRQTAAPVLIVRGLASASLSKRTAEELCAATRNGRLAIVPRAGHAVMNDNGEGFAQAVIPFVVRASAVVQTG